MMDMLSAHADCCPSYANAPWLRLPSLSHQSIAHINTQTPKVDVYVFRAEVWDVVYIHYMQCAQCTYHEIIKTFSILTTRCDAIRFHRVPIYQRRVSHYSVTYSSRMPSTHTMYLCVSQKHTISIKLQFKCRFSLSGKTNAVSIIWNEI